jgi:hypothetical protein
MEKVTSRDLPGRNGRERAKARREKREEEWNHRKG